MKYTRLYMQIFKKVVLLSIAAVMLIFSACGEEKTVGQDVNESEIPVVTLPPVEKEPVPKIGGELVFAMPENPATINPLKINNG